MVIRGHWLALIAALLSTGIACKKGNDTAPPATDSTPNDADADADDDEEGELEDPEESPYLDFSNFNDRVEEHEGEIVACYQETAGKEAEAPTGRVKSTFVIDGDGKVKEIKFDGQRSTLQHDALNKCIEEAGSAWVFNISLTGVDTTMPYTFELESGALLP